MLNKNSFVALKNKMKAMSATHLKIVELEEAAVNTMRVRTVLKDLKEKKKFTPDIIFLDYVGCMIPNGRPNPNLNTNTILQKVVAEWRGSICMKLGIPTVTGFQVNRGGADSASVGLTDIADSFGSTTKVDAMFATTQDQTMMENGMYKLKVAKTRLKNNKGTEVMIGVCIDKQQIYDLNSSPTARTPQLTNTTPASTPASIPASIPIQIPQTTGNPVQESMTTIESTSNADTAEQAYVATAKVDLDKINSIL